jgi:hypothetical protein
MNDIDKFIDLMKSFGYSDDIVEAWLGMDESRVRLPRFPYVTDAFSERIVFVFDIDGKFKHLEYEDA